VHLRAKSRKVWQRISPNGINCGLTSKSLELVRHKRQRHHLYSDYRVVDLYNLTMTEVTAFVPDLFQLSSFIAVKAVRDPRAYRLELPGINLHGDVEPVLRMPTNVKLHMYVEYQKLSSNILTSPKLSSHTLIHFSDSGKDGFSAPNEWLLSSATSSNVEQMSNLCGALRRMFQDVFG
jgi:hypothetical protein